MAKKRLFLRFEQLLIGRVVTQRSERRVELHHPAPRIPLSERLLHQRHRRVTLADHGVDPRAPHRVPAIEIPWGHRLKLAIDAECFLALALARCEDAEQGEGDPWTG